ncbi:MAG: ATP-binding protein [Syntrophales bacterium]|nr:ATP-binding protein [Syntrophales bacterium]
MSIDAEQIGVSMMYPIRHDNEAWLMRKRSRLCLTLLLMAALALGGCTKLPEPILHSLTTWAIGLFFMLLLLIAFNHWLSRPLHHLMETVRRFSAGDYAARARISGRGELAELARAFNEMAEEVLTKSGRLQAVLNAATESAIVATDENDLVTLFNRGAEQMLGYTAEEVIGKQTPEIWHLGSELSARSEAFSRKSGRPIRGIAVFSDHARHGRFKADECTCVRKDGSHLTVQLFVTAIRNERGDIQGFLGMAQDITEHRKLEEQMLQVQKMESIGTLAGGIAHDFNNILSAVIGYGHITLIKMAHDDPLRLNIEHMLEAAERAANLTKDILLFSRKQISNRRPVDINEIIRKVEKFLLRVIGEDIACKTILSEGAIPVLANLNHIEQVLMNLAANARDAMPKGGAFTVATERIRLDEEFVARHGYGVPGLYAMITVRDTGIGMDVETQHRIFEPFFTTREVGKGTGLGLSVVYGIIKQHDGYNNAYSEVGMGTTFRIYLPVIASAASEEERTAAEPPERGTETILLAEDNEVLRNLTLSVLQEFGYTVIVAKDGEEAVNKYKENRERIRLLLFDLVMPKKNGKEAYDEIREMTPGIKVIFVSGYAPDIIRQRKLLEDNVAVIHKPVLPSDILKKVRSVLDNCLSR